MTPQERMGQIHEREQAATKGEWHASVCISGEECWCRCISSNILDEDGVEDTVTSSGCVNKPDAEFISNAKQDIPWLLARLINAEALLRDLRGWGHGKDYKAINKFLDGDEK